MEILILAMMLGWVVKNGVKDLIHAGSTAVCAVQGKPAPAWGSRRRAKRPSGAASRYFAQLWNDSWEDALAKHVQRHARRNAAGPGDAGGAIRSFLRGDGRDGYRFTHRKWHAAWNRLKALRYLKKRSRPRPGQETVLGTVVPNAEDGDGGRPQDRPGPEPRTVPTEDGRTDLRFGEDGDDPTGTGRCPECRGTVLVDGEICLSCRDRQEQRNQHHEDQSSPGNPPESGTDQEDRSDDMTEDERQWAAYERFLEGAAKLDEKFHPSPATPTTEGPTTMTTTMPTDTEVTSLNKAIQYSESTAHVAREMVNSIDFTVASLASGGVTGIAVAEFTKAKEDFGSIASAFDRAAKEFKDQLAIQEAYNANPGAGTKEFIMGGR